MSASRYEYELDPAKANNTAAAIYRLARDGGTKLLDLGSGPGIVAGALSRWEDKQVTCVDLEADHLDAAAERGVAHTVAGDLETGDWLPAVAGDRYDVIVLADVLEHLVEPGRLLRTILEEELLADDGFLVISVPNAAHIGILTALAGGDFPYRPTGLLDATHLRFFTLESLGHLLEEEGFAITRVARTTRRLDQTEFADLADRVDVDALRRVVAHPESETYQYVLRAEPLGAEVPLQLARAHETLEHERERRRKTSARLRRQRREREALEKELEQLRASWTWRVGRLVTGVPGRMRRRGS